MIIDKRHYTWAAYTAGAALFLAVCYLANFRPDILPIPWPAFFGPRPPLRGSIGSTPLGLIYGLLAFLIFIFAALLGARRARPAARVGRVRTWLKAHIWLSILTIPLVLMHSGFAVGGPMTELLLWLYGIVMVSGFFGLAMQHLLPRLMKDNVPLETIFEQIPHIRRLLLTNAQAMRKSFEPAPAQPVVAGAAPAPLADHGDAITETLLRDVIDQEIIPYVSLERGESHKLGNIYLAEQFFRALKLNVEPKFHPSIEQMQSWVDERRQLDLQIRLHHWMHGWLFVHAPVSVLLLVLTAWHAIVAVFKY